MILTYKLAKADHYCLQQLRKDEDKLKRVISEIRTIQNEVFNSLERKVVDEISRERKRVDNLLSKMEKTMSSTYDHLVTLQERNEVFRSTLEAELRKYQEEAELKLHTVEVPVGKSWYGLDAIIKIVYLLSYDNGVRNFGWEAASYGFLIPAVFERALAVDSKGYLLNEPVPSSKLQEIANGLKGYLPSSESWVDNWEILSENVKETWIELILPEIYGGSDPYWEDDEPLSVEYMQIWLEDKSINPIYQDAVKAVYDGKNEQN